MRQTIEDASSLRAEVDAAVMHDVATYGPAFDRAALVTRFLSRGISRATVYRWIDAVLKSGRPGEHMAEQVRAMAEHAARSPDPGDGGGGVEIDTILPPAIRLDDLMGSGIVGVVERLSRCADIAERVLAHSQTTDGKIRNSKLMLQASEHMRRTIETAARLHAGLDEQHRMTEFLQAMMDVVHNENPDAARRILLRFRQVRAASRAGLSLRQT